MGKNKGGNRPGSAARPTAAAAAAAAPSSLAGLIAQQRLKGVQLAGKQKQALTKAIQQSGQGGQGRKITAAELRTGKKGYKGEDYLATVGRTYAAQRLAQPVRKKLEKKGFTKDSGGYYTKSGPITQNVLDKVLGAGYSEGDVRDYLAKNFAQGELDNQIGKFLGEGGGYKLNPDTGKWEKQGLGPDDGKEYPVSPVTPGEGPYAGIDPNAGEGATPAEIGYATAVDPYKIEAKSRERLGSLQAGLGAYLGRLDSSTTYDVAKLNRIAGLQQAQTQQATSLYNLIPSAFG